MTEQNPNKGEALPVDVTPHVEDALELNADEFSQSLGELNAELEAEHAKKEAAHKALIDTLPGGKFDATIAPLADRLEQAIDTSHFEAAVHEAQQMSPEERAKMNAAAHDASDEGHAAA